MKQLALGLCLFLSALTARAAVNVRFNFQDFTTAPQGIKRVIMTPLSTPAAITTNIVSLDRRTLITTAGGSVTFSNVYVPATGTNGSSYLVELQGNNTSTLFTNTFPAGLTGTVDGSTYLSVDVAEDASGTAYSQAVSESLFLNASGDNGILLTNVSTTNLVGDITADQITSGAFIAGSGGFGTNTLFVGTAVRHPSFTNRILLGTSDNVQASINHFGNNGLELHADLNNGGISWWISNQKSMTLLATSADPIFRVTETYNKTLGSSERGAGSTVSAFIPRIGGSGASIQDLPLHGAEIWQNQPKPVFGMRIGGGTLAGLSEWTASHTNMVSVVTNFQAEGIPDVLTNAGISLVVMTDTGWLLPHRVGGLLAPDTSLFPNITNSIGFAHTNGFEFWVNAYFNQAVPTVGNTEIDCNVAGHVGSIFQHPLEANPNGSDYIHPMMTPNSVRTDIDTFYGWGADGIGVQDTNPWNAISGYEFLRSRMLANAVTYPRTGYYWAALYDTWFDHGMTLTLFANTPHVPSLAYECNAMILDNFVTGVPENDGQAPLNTSPVSLGVAYARAFNRVLHHGPAESVRPTFLLSFGVEDADDWGDQGYKGFFGLAAVMRGNIFFQQPLSDYATLGDAIKNLNFLWLWKNNNGKPWLAMDDGDNSVWASTLTDKATMAALANEHLTTPVSIHVSWDHLKIASNTVCGVYDGWTNTWMGDFTNSYTVTVGPTNALLRVFIPRTHGTNITGRIPHAALPTVVVTNNTTVATTVAANLNVTGFTAIGTTPQNNFELYIAPLGGGNTDVNLVHTARNLYIGKTATTTLIQSDDPFTIGAVNGNNIILSTTGTGRITVPRLQGSSSTPGIAAGAGAGASPTVAIAGTDLAGRITLTTGTTATAAATLVTVTFSAAYGVAPYPVITPGNAATAALSGATQVFPGTTTTTLTLTSGSTPLTDATQYIWYYHAIQ